MTSVSVIIPVHNQRDFVRNAVLSVTCKTVGVELVLVDDASDFSIVDCLKDLQSSFKLEKVSYRNACAARNHGFASTVGEYLLFLDADDYLSEDYLSEMMAVASASSADLVLGKCVEVYPGGNTRERSFCCYNDAVSWLEHVMCTEKLQTGQMLWRREFFCKIGGWDERVIVSQDVELSIRGLLAHPSIATCETGFCAWRRHHNEKSISKNNMGRSALESGLGWFSRLAPQIVTLGRQALTQRLASMFYYLAVVSYRDGHDDIARAALEERAKLGATGPEGTIKHRLVVRFLGLRNAMRLVRLKQNFLGNV